MRYVDLVLRLSIMIKSYSWLAYAWQKSWYTVSFLTFFSIRLLQTLIPLDFKRAGQILDDDLYDRLVKRMREGVTVVVLMDCCHSGTALDLPYEINATQSKMSFNQGFDIGRFEQAALCCMCLFYLSQILLDWFSCVLFLRAWTFFWAQWCSTDNAVLMAPSFQLFPAPMKK